MATGTPGRRGALAATAAGVLLLTPVWAGPGPALLAGASAITLALVVLTRGEGSGWGRAAAALAVLAPAALWLASGGAHPAQGMAVGIALAALLGLLYAPADLRDLERRDTRAEPLLRAPIGAAWAALCVLGLAWVLDDGAPTTWIEAGLRCGVAWAPAWLAPASVSRIAWGRATAWLLPVALGVLAALVRAPDLAHPWLLSVGPAALLLSAAPQSMERREGLSLPTHPSALLVSSFAAICAVGTVLLTLPGTAAEGVAVPGIDAAFTAVSATCVTGLIVRDTPHDFTVAGQAVILLLIQVGGLGIMTFSAAIFALLGRRMSLAQEATAAELVGASARSDIAATVRRILVVTAVTELLGAAALAWRFVAYGDTWSEAAWRGLFTAISAFCNAGFALQSDSLVPYQRDPWVLLVIACLIVIGGLGPAVVVVVPAWLRGRRTSLHARLVLGTTAALLMAAFGLYLVLEWNQTLAHLGGHHRVVNAFFQAVTLRTAGFNSVDLAAVRPATWTLLLAFMWVGGSPGSTAGGIKTTTFAILLLTLLAAARGEREVILAGRQVPHRTVYEAASLLTMAVACTIGALVALQLTQDMPLDVAAFEVVSALATVGLSIGGTDALDDVGKVIVIGCMFAGRVGPMSLFALLATARDGERVAYPEDRVPVG